MKKLLILIILLFIPFMVYAESCETNKVTISNISLVENSNGVIEVSDASINNNQVFLNLKFKNLNDSVKYKLTIKNDSKEDYEIGNNIINSNYEYMTYELKAEDNVNIIKSGTSKEATLSIVYRNQVPDSAFIGNKYNENKTITIDLSSGDNVVNPKTGNDSYVFILIMFIIGFSFIYLIINKNKYSKYFIIFMLLIPIGLKAVCRVEIKFASNIEIEKIPDADASLGNYYNVNTGNHYQTLNDAFLDVSSNQTIRVLNSITENVIAVLNNEKENIKLDLNGQTITINGAYIDNNGELDIYNTSNNEATIFGGSDRTINNNGLLTLNKTSYANKIIIEKSEVNKEYSTIYNNSLKTLIVYDNVEIKSNGRDYYKTYSISNFGEATINGGSIIGKYSSIFNDKNGLLTINGNNVEIMSSKSSTSFCISNQGILSVNSGKITGHNSAISNLSTGKLNISGKDTQIIGTEGGAISNSGVATISGGTLTGKNSGVSNSSDGIMTISGDDTKITGRLWDAIDNSGEITVKGGTITADRTALENRGTVTIEGGMLTGRYGLNIVVSASQSGTVFSGTTTITGGTIIGSIYGIYVEKGIIVNVGTKDSIIKNTPVIESTRESNGYGVTVATGGTFNFYDGIIKSASGEGTAIKRDPDDIPLGYEIKKETVDGIERAYLVISGH